MKEERGEEERRGRGTWETADKEGERKEEERKEEERRQEEEHIRIIKN